MHLSEHGLEFIKRHEGWHPCYYVDENQNAHIGYGHFIVEPKYRSWTCITKEQGTHLLRLDLHPAIHCVNAHVKVPLNQNQFDALVDLVHNVGCNKFAESDLLKAINNGNFNAVDSEFRKWDIEENTELSPFRSRREEESILFNTPVHHYTNLL